VLSGDGFGFSVLTLAFSKTLLSSFLFTGSGICLRILFDSIGNSVCSQLPSMLFQVAEKMNQSENTTKLLTCVLPLAVYYINGAGSSPNVPLNFDLSAARADRLIAN